MTFLTIPTPTARLQEPQRRWMRMQLQEKGDHATRRRIANKSEELEGLRRSDLSDARQLPVRIAKLSFGTHTATQRSSTECLAKMRSSKSRLGQVAAPPWSFTTLDMHRNFLASFRWAGRDRVRVEGGWRSSVRYARKGKCFTLLRSVEWLARAEELLTDRVTLWQDLGVPRRWTRRMLYWTLAFTTLRRKCE